MSLLRTIELILGLPPMSQYDAAAVPMGESFGDQPDLLPFTTLKNTYPLDEITPSTAYGGELSSRMNFTALDAAPEELLNEIVWKSVKGDDSEMSRPHTNRAWRGLPEED